MEPSSEIWALRERMDQWFVAHRAEHDADARAVVLARNVSDRALELTRAALEIRLETMAEDIKRLNRVVNMAVGGTTLIAGAAGVIIAFLMRG